MTCSVDMDLDSSLPCEKGVMYIVNCRTSMGFSTNSGWSVVVSYKRNTRECNWKQEDGVTNFWIFVCLAFFS